MEGNPESVLVISAHPDDLDFGCSGTIALWTREGTKVVYVICTNGDKGSDDLHLSSEGLVRLRETEQRNAAKVVGVKDVVFLGFEDGELTNSPALRRKLVRTIRLYRPQVVLCQDPANREFVNPRISHRDHREAAEAAFDAIYPAAANPRFFPELLAQGLEPHRVEEVFFYSTHAPNFWVDVTEVWDTKLQAIRCHRSQIRDWKWIEGMLHDYFSELGRGKGYTYAEAFRRVKIT